MLRTPPVAYHHYTEETAECSWCSASRCAVSLFAGRHYHIRVFPTLSRAGCEARPMGRECAAHGAAQRSNRRAPHLHSDPKRSGRRAAQVVANPFQENLGSVAGQVSVSVNGGKTVPVTVDTGSAGLVLPINDIGLQHLGLPTGFHMFIYGTSQQNLTEFAVSFDTTINFGNGIVTAPTQVSVPIFSIEHLNLSLINPISIPLPGGLSPIEISSIPLTLAYPDLPPFTNLFPLGGSGAVGILGVGPSGLAPSNPVTTALPGQLSQGVLINAPGHYLEFGPNPLAAGVSVPGSPITTLDVQINNGPLTSVTAAIDSGGQYGSIPSSAGRVPPSR